MHWCRCTMMNTRRNIRTSRRADVLGRGAKSSRLSSNLAMPPAENESRLGCKESADGHTGTQACRSRCPHRWPPAKGSEPLPRFHARPNVRATEVSRRACPTGQMPLPRLLIPSPQLRAPSVPPAAASTRNARLSQSSRRSFAEAVPLPPPLCNCETCDHRSCLETLRHAGHQSLAIGRVAPASEPTILRLPLPCPCSCGSERALLLPLTFSDPI